jgi:hypothetical protein
MMPLPGPPEDAVELSFEPIHEVWSIYRTKDNVLIKIRMIILHFKLAGIKEEGSALLVSGGNLLFAVTSPKKGPPSTQVNTNEQIVAAIIEPDVAFDTVKEDWSEYSVEGVKVGIKVIATVIAKTSLFDGNGDPIYYVNYQTIVRAITKPEDKTKFKKIWDERRTTRTSAPNPAA